MSQNNSTLMEFEEFVDYYEISITFLSIILLIPTFYVWYILKFYHQNRIKSSFMKLFNACVAVDLSASFVLIFTVKLPWCGLFPFYRLIANGIIPTVFYFLLYYFMYVQFMGNVLLAVNRLFAILLVKDYEFLMNRFFPLFWAFLFIVPLVFSISIFYRTAEYVAFAPASFVLQPASGNTAQDGYMSSIVGVVAILVALLINLYIIYSLKSLKKKADRFDRAEKRFHKTSVIMFVFLLFCVINQFFVHFVEAGPMIRYIAMQMMSLLMSVNCLVPCWTMVLLNAEIRSIIVKRMRGQKNNTVIPNVSLTEVKPF